MKISFLIFNWFIIIILIISIILNNAIDFDLFDNEQHLKINNILKIQDSKYHNLFQNQLWINEMTKNGAIIIPDILSHSDCDSILKIISNERNDINHFSENIRLNDNREYIMLPLEKTAPFVTKIYMQLKHFCDTLLPNPKLLETSSFTTYNGCLRQKFHTDGNFKDNDNAFTFGIALDDITQDMGPLEFYIGSQKISSPDSLNYLTQKYNLPYDPYDSEDDFDGETKYEDNNNQMETVCNALNIKKKICTCKKGSLVIWSWSVIHRGTENNNKIRPVFYFSMKNGNLTFLDGVRHNLKKRNNLTYILSEYHEKYDIYSNNN